MTRPSIGSWGLPPEVAREGCCIQAQTTRTRGGAAPEQRAGPALAAGTERIEPDGIAVVRWTLTTAKEAACRCLREIPHTGYRPARRPRRAWSHPGPCGRVASVDA